MGWTDTKDVSRGLGGGGLSIGRSHQGLPGPGGARVLLSPHREV
jgi:hypothetical protein